MIERILTENILKGLSKLYGQNVPESLVQIQKTRQEFEGDRTINVFPLLKFSRKNPEVTANDLGNYLDNHMEEISSFNVIKGFLNLTVTDKYWFHFYSNYINKQDYGKANAIDENPMVVEFSSPNTNKPLHLGHIRNNLLGWSVSEIVKAAGHTVAKVNLVNDRGIHICKSMLAWQKWGMGITPEIAGEKGDKLVGDFYVKFDQEYKKEVNELTEKGREQKQAELEAPMLTEAKILLKAWENEDKQVRELWRQMNSWVYEGFDKTYNRLGIEFDKTYYESDTYLLGKKLVEEGLEKGILL